MIKVCHMTSAHNQFDDRIFEKECRSLANNSRYEVFCVSEGYSVDKEGVHLIGVGEKPHSRVKRMLSFTKEIYKAALKVDADIYHIHDPELLGCCKKLKKRNKIVVFDSHENYSAQIKEKAYINKYVRNAISKIYRHWETKITMKIDAVIFPAPIDGKHPFEKRCKNLIYLNNYPSLTDVVDKYGNERKTKKTCACYTGGLSDNRGIVEIIKACYLAKVKLILAGSFESEEFEKKVKSLKEFSIVEFRGQCNRKQINEILYESSVGLNVLKNVGQYANLPNLSTKVYEYMTFELPVIINEYPYGDSLINMYNFGVSVPCNIDNIKDALIQITANNEIAEKMGSNGRKLILSKFNWGIEERKLFKLYEKLVNENQA